MNICAIDNRSEDLGRLLTAIYEAAPQARIASYTRVEDALAGPEPFGYDVAFIALEPPSTSGISYAQKLREHNDKANIIFIATSAQRMSDVLGTRFSGFLIKPITAESIADELNNLRYPVAQPPAKPRLRVQCFGNFEAFVDNRPLALKSEQAKELLAYLVDRKGAKCSVREIESVLWEGRPHSESQQSHLRHLSGGLQKSLEAAGCDNVLMRKYGALWILTNNIDCDYYDYLLGHPSVWAKFRGEYMSQYSWAERTLANLLTYE